MYAYSMESSEPKWTRKSLFEGACIASCKLAISVRRHTAPSRYMLCELKLIKQDRAHETKASPSSQRQRIVLPCACGAGMKADMSWQRKLSIRATVHSAMCAAGLDSKGSVPSPRVAHSAVVIGHSIWIFGGRSGELIQLLPGLNQRCEYSEMVF